MYSVTVMTVMTPMTNMVRSLRLGPRGRGLN